MMQKIKLKSLWVSFAPNKDNIIYQIVFPKTFAEYRYFSTDFMDFLEKSLV